VRSDELEISIYEDDGNVVIVFETAEGEIPIALRPDLADEFCDKVREAIAEARAKNPAQ
jgi:hypothetical protein